MKKKIIKVKPKKKKQEYDKSVPTFMKNFKPPLVVVKNEYGELELVSSGIKRIEDFFERR